MVCQRSGIVPCRDLGNPYIISSTLAQTFRCRGLKAHRSGCHKFFLTYVPHLLPWASKKKASLSSVRWEVSFIASFASWMYFVHAPVFSARDDPNGLTSGIEGKEVLVPWTMVPVIAIEWVLARSATASSRYRDESDKY